MYMMMNAEELADYIFDLHLIGITTVNFTFDVMDSQGNFCTSSGKPEGWHGVKLINPFESETYTMAIGYYGGFTTDYYECPYLRSRDSEVHWIAKMLHKYFKDVDEFDSYGQKVCVEVEECKP